MIQIKIMEEIMKKIMIILMRMKKIKKLMAIILWKNL